MSLPANDKAHPPWRPGELKSEKLCAAAVRWGPRLGGTRAVADEGQPIHQRGSEGRYGDLTKKERPVAIFLGILVPQARLAQIAANLDEPAVAGLPRVRHLPIELG